MMMMVNDLFPDDGMPVKCDPNNPLQCNRLYEIVRLCRQQGFGVHAADVWRPSLAPVVIDVAGDDAEPIEDDHVIRDAVVLGVPDAHTYVALLCFELRERARARRRNQ